MRHIITLNEYAIKNKVYIIRGLSVMMDRDLANLYGIDKRRLVEKVKKNITIFPSDFMFQLTKEELENWKSKFTTSNQEFIRLRKMPYVFTAKGISMLNVVLKKKLFI